MFYVYIIYSETADRFYIGHTNDPDRRIWEHNTSEKYKFTARYRPWIFQIIVPVSEKRGDAIKVEKFIKKQKSKQFIKSLIQSANEPDNLSGLIMKIVG